MINISNRIQPLSRTQYDPASRLAEDESFNYKIRILIVDDHDLMRVGLRSFLNKQADIQVVGEAADGEEAVRMERELSPDVITMDLLMPRKDGIEAIADIRRANPAARIIVLTSYPDLDRALPAIRSGALGFMLKTASPQDLITAIRQVYSYGVYLHASMAREILQALRQSPIDGPVDSTLTDREITILKMVAHGLSNKEIALGLAISERTVGVHISHLLEKLNLENRTQAALYALRHGLIGLYSK